MTQNDPTPGANPAYDAAALLDGLSDLPPRERALAEGRLLQALNESLAARLEAVAETERVIAAVIDLLEARDGSRQ